MKTTDQIRQLTNTELSHELTETRITLESIYPYKCRDISEYRSQLWAEYNRRRPPVNPLVFAPTVKTHNETCTQGLAFDGEVSFADNCH